MMSCRIQTEKLAVGHMGKPGQRVPHRKVNVREGIPKTDPSQSFLNVPVLSDINIVVVIDKIVVDDLAVNRNRKCYNQKTNQNPAQSTTFVLFYDERVQYQYTLCKPEEFLYYANDIGIMMRYKSYPISV